MASARCFHAHEGRIDLRHESKPLGPIEALARDNDTSVIEADQVEPGLANINTDCSYAHDFLHWAYSTKSMLPGADHPIKHDGLLPTRCGG